MSRTWLTCQKLRSMKSSGNMLHTHTIVYTLILTLAHTHTYTRKGSLTNWHSCRRLSRHNNVDFKAKLLESFVALSRSLVATHVARSVALSVCRYVCLSVSLFVCLSLFCSRLVLSASDCLFLLMSFKLLSVGLYFHLPISLAVPFSIYSPLSTYSPPSRPLSTSLPLLFLSPSLSFSPTLSPAVHLSTSPKVTQMINEAALFLADSLATGLLRCISPRNTHYAHTSPHFLYRLLPFPHYIHNLSS